MKQCPEDLELEAYVDGQAGKDHAKITCHLAGCTDCRAKVDDLHSLNQLIITVEGQQIAPRILVDRLRRESMARTTASGRISRRWMLRGGLATAACLGGIVAYQSHNTPSAYELQSTLFGDFLTLVAADRQLDFQSRASTEVIDWFRSRVPFSLPNLAGLDGLDIRGGRLCWLAERRFAAMDFRDPGGSYCLYICQADHLTVNVQQDIPAIDAAPVAIEQNGISGVFWRRGQTALSLIGDLAANDLAAIAGRVRQQQIRGESS